MRWVISAPWLNRNMLMKNALHNSIAVKPCRHSIFKQAQMLPNIIHRFGKTPPGLAGLAQLKTTSTLAAYVALNDFLNPLCYTDGDACASAHAETWPNLQRKYPDGSRSALAERTVGGVQNAAFSHSNIKGLDQTIGETTEQKLIQTLIYHFPAVIA